MLNRGAEIFIAATSALLLLCGIYVARIEAPPILNYGLSPDEAFDAIGTGDVAPAASLFSLKSTLKLCLAALSSSYGLAQPATRRGAVLDRCDAMALSIARQNPTDGFAWTIAAMVAAERQDWPALNSDLRHSSASTSYEDWVAQLRFGVAEDQWDRLDAEARIEHDSDVRVLVQSKDGAAMVVGRFVDDTAFRTRVAALIETLPPADQRRFLDGVDEARRTDAPT